MANSLEARSPFLDRELVEYAAGLPDDLKLQGRRTKAILRDAFPDLVPPAIERRGKMGFGVPLDTWFRGELRDYMRDLLLLPGARYRDMLSGAFVEALVARHLAGGANLGQQLWSIICFEVWLRRLPEWTAR
jgi:asparagine synthase (glutamine-hydrolysing)